MKAPSFRKKSIKKCILKIFFFEKKDFFHQSIHDFTHMLVTILIALIGRSDFFFMASYTV